MNPDVEKAVAALAKVDKKIGRHIQQVGPCALGLKKTGRSHFEQLARSITYQQLAGRAAETIWGRVRLLVDGPFDAGKILELSDAELRGAGLSRNKMLSLQDLAQHVVDKQLPLRRIGSMDDEEVIEALTHVRGIGRWTAEMFLMSQLGRINVWPVGDLGVRNGYRLIYGLPEMPRVSELSDHGNKFSPYRSIAAWYCWRAVDIPVPVV